MTDAVRVAVERIPHPDVEAFDLATIMRTVGDPVRLAIVRELADGREQACSALQASLGIPASTGSYHLRLLRLPRRAIGRARVVGVLTLLAGVAALTA